MLLSSEEELAAIANKVPMKRVAAPEEVNRCPQSLSLPDMHNFLGGICNRFPGIAVE